MTTAPSKADLTGGSEPYPSDDDVVWTTQSESSAESMPCGGGDIGMNVWVEAGDLQIYVERSASHDENNQQLKLGRLRIRIDGDPFASDFTQRLVLERGRVELHGGAGADAVDVLVWADVDSPSVYVDIHSPAPRSVSATFETWRMRDRELDEGDRMAAFSLWTTTPDEIPARTHADVILPTAAAIEWYHRNDNTDLIRDKLIIAQNLGSVSDQIPNPQYNSIFGARLSGEGFRFAGTGSGRYAGTDFDSWTLTAAGATDHHLELCAVSGSFATPEHWQATVEKQAGFARARRDEAEQASLAWWSAFWERSWIRTAASRSAESSGRPDVDSVRHIGRNYQLFRYQMGCNAKGDFPTKFNGSLFTVDPDGVDAHRTPDFRRWGGGSATAQNQRLVYYPLLASGDIDLMLPQFEFYRHALPGAEARTRAYWNHPGASFAEQVENFGLPCGDVYESHWGHRGVAPRPGPDQGALLNDFCSDEYDTVLEFCHLILEAHRYSRTDIARYLPLIDACLTFFDEHYRRLERERNGRELANGKLVLYPSSAGETYKDAVNSVTTICGLRSVLSELIESRLGSEADRARWQELLERVPEIPLRELNGRTVIAPAESWSRIQNEEFPQLYPVYPWGIYGVGRPRLQRAIDTFHYGADIPDQGGINGWKQNPNFAVRLGLTTEAAAMVLEKLRDSERRFPTFWGPNFDWTPDFNHAGSGVAALQEMLVQTDGRVIHLFPAWPPQWDVHFRLHAPYETTIEGRLIDGVVTELEVTPRNRFADVVVHPLAVEA